MDDGGGWCMAKIFIREWTPMTAKGENRNLETGIGGSTGRAGENSVCAPDSAVENDARHANANLCPMPTQPGSGIGTLDVMMKLDFREDFVEDVTGQAGVNEMKLTEKMVDDFSMV